ncbi:hypothetical protein V1525DRAFT_413749, partial [Lipomyces kononenkoae]
ARSKRSKASRENSRKKYRIDAQADMEKPELSKPLGDFDFAEDEIQAEYDGTDSQTRRPNTKLVYFAEADKSLKRTIYIGGSERTQRRWRAKFKSNVNMRSLFGYNFSSSKQDTDSADGAAGMLSVISSD